MTVAERLRDKANSLPMSSGVYIMKDIEGKIIYVGKSKKLKNRVGSYFTGSNHTPKTAKMVSLVRDFDYIVCDSEIEALTLENTLIKKHSPKYNIKLKDAKSYPYIKLTNGQYPRLFVTRDRKNDNSKYYGPYSSAKSAYTALETVMKIFSLPNCKRQFPRDIGKERPCIYKDMGRCIAPCVSGTDAELYRSLVKKAEWVLDGNIKSTSDMLREDMQRAAENERFEEAALLRDSISALTHLKEKQKVVADLKVSRDVFALYTSETEGALAILSVREGSLVNKNEFILSLSELTSPEDALSLIVNYYDTAGSIPKEIMLGFSLEEDDAALLAEYLTVCAGRKVNVIIPKRGERRELCEMALENAMEAAKQSRLEGQREDKSVKRLAELLGLPYVPNRIEAYDISNIGNEHITAAMVVWQNGKLKKSDYRSFKITTTDGQDDYSAMKEALTRRIKHISDGTASLTEAPDVILIDGGAGHVNAVKEILSGTELDIRVFGMVKDDYHKTRAITDGKTEISIAREMNVYSFVYNLQEEVHRFAYKNTSNAKRKSLTRSSLEQIYGIGQSKARMLLNQMPLAKIKTASVDELSSLKGISKADANRIYEHFRVKKK